MTSSSMASRRRSIAAVASVFATCVGHSTSELVESSSAAVEVDLTKIVAVQPGKIAELEARLNGILENNARGRPKFTETGACTLATLKANVDSEAVSCEFERVGRMVNVFVVFKVTRFHDPSVPSVEGSIKINELPFPPRNDAKGVFARIHGNFAGTVNVWKNGNEVHFFVPHEELGDYSFTLNYVTE